jgi:hypothetical protein
MCAIAAPCQGSALMKCVWIGGDGQGRTRRAAGGRRGGWSPVCIQHVGGRRRGGRRAQREGYGHARSARMPSIAEHAARVSASPPSATLSSAAVLARRSAPWTMGLNRAPCSMTRANWPLGCGCDQRHISEIRGRGFPRCRGDPGLRDIDRSDRADSLPAQAERRTGCQLRAIGLVSISAAERGRQSPMDCGRRR